MNTIQIEPPKNTQPHQQNGAAINNANDLPKKKTPGRPRKKPLITPAQILGVINSPMNQENYIEFIFQSPILFKKISTMFRAMNIPEIYFQFTPNKVVIDTKDHLDKSDVRIEIDCNKVTRYYCEAPLEVGVKREHFESVFHYYDKSFNSVVFFLKKSNYRSTMYISSEVRDASLDYGDLNILELITNKKDEQQRPAFPTDDAYPIKFMLPTAHLKKRVNSITSVSSTMCIEKIGDEPLTINYMQSRKINKKSTYPDGAKMNLISKVQPDDIFAVSVYIISIKPFISSLITDNIFISADISKKLMLMYKTENCKIQMFTDIVRIDGSA